MTSTALQILHIQKADRALKGARLLLAADDTDGACSRAYYAMFDAAHAALIASGASQSTTDFKTHSGLIAAFGQHIVRTNLLAPEFGRSLNQVEDMRLLADYTGDPVPHKDAAWSLEKAEAFVEAVRQKFSIG